MTARRTPAASRPKVFRKPQNLKDVAKVPKVLVINEAAGPCAYLIQPRPASACLLPALNCLSLRSACRERKDPRFEDLSGRYDPGRFRKQYAFLYDEALPQERAAVKAKLKVLLRPA